MARVSSEERLAQAGECLESGLTVKARRKEQGLSPQAMYERVKRVREGHDSGPAPAFVEVAAEEDRAQAVPIVARVGAVEPLLTPGFTEADAAAAMRAAATL